MKLPELKRRFKNRYVIRIAAGVLTIAVAGGSAGVYTVNAAKTSTKADRIYHIFWWHPLSILMKRWHAN